MKFALTLFVPLAVLLAGCSFDASSRPIPPAPATVINQDSQAYCCDSCAVDDEQAVCESCQPTSANSCAGDAERLLCVSNRVEEPQTASTFRVTCY